MLLSVPGSIILYSISLCEWELLKTRDFGNMKTPLPGVRDGKILHSIKLSTSQCMKSKWGKIQKTIEM